LERGLSAILIGRIDDFYEHVCDLLAWSEEKLVRYAGGDVDDIAGFDCDPGAALDPAALYLAGRRALRVDHLCRCAPIRARDAECIASISKSLECAGDEWNPAQIGFRLTVAV